jgi:hypothetical protein
MGVKLLASMLNTATCSSRNSKSGKRHKLEVMTGTGDKACSSLCHKTKKPQLVVMALAPLWTKSQTASPKAGANALSAKHCCCVTINCGNAPRITTSFTFGPQLLARPKSPGNLGKSVSSLIKPKHSWGKAVEAGIVFAFMLVNLSFLIF